MSDNNAHFSSISNLTIVDVSSKLIEILLAHV